MLLPGIGWPGGSLENTGIIVGVVAGAYVGALWLAAIAWTIRDIRERTQDPVTRAIATAIVVVFNLPGWVLYLVLRPQETLTEAYERQLEEEALLQDLQAQLACPACGVRVEDDYVACPQCATTLKAPCESCGQALAFSWVTCPWCATPRESAGYHPPRRPTPAAGPSMRPDAPTAAAPRPVASTAPAAPATPAPPRHPAAARPDDGETPFRRQTGAPSPPRGASGD